MFDSVVMDMTRELFLWHDRARACVPCQSSSSSFFLLDVKHNHMQYHLQNIIN